MTTAASSTLTAEPRAFSVGPQKIQILKLAVVSGDTAATLTATNLTTISAVVIGGGLIVTSDPTFSGNVATLAFSDPAANRFATVLCIGR